MATCLVGILKKMINFIYKKILIAWNRANMHSPYPANLVSMLGHVHKMPVQVGKAIKRDMLFLTCTHLGISQKKKINIAAVNMSKVGQSFV